MRNEGTFIVGFKTRVQLALEYLLKNKTISINYKDFHNFKDFRLFKEKIDDFAKNN
jgi:hypothetical protein